MLHHLNKFFIIFCPHDRDQRLQKDQGGHERESSACACAGGSHEADSEKLSFQFCIILWRAFAVRLFSITADEPARDALWFPASPISAPAKESLQQTEHAKNFLPPSKHGSQYGIIESGIPFWRRKNHPHPDVESTGRKCGKCWRRGRCGKAVEFTGGCPQRFQQPKPFSFLGKFGFSTAPTPPTATATNYYYKTCTENTEVHHAYPH